MREGEAETVSRSRFVCRRPVSAHKTIHRKHGRPSGQGEGLALAVKDLIRNSWTGRPRGAPLAMWGPVAEGLPVVSRIVP